MNETASIALAEAERDWLAPEVVAFARSIADPAGRKRYEALERDVERGTIAPDQFDALARLLEVALTSGRIRHNSGPAGEQALMRLYQRLPEGRERAGWLKEVNAALEALREQVLDEVTITMRTPGEYVITLDTNRCQIAIAIGRSGVRVDHLSLGI